MSTNGLPSRAFWTVGQIAQTFQVKNHTVREWLREGNFPNAIKTPTSKPTARGVWRVPHADVVAFAERGYGER